VLNSEAGERELVYVIEDHGNGRATVLLPWAPAAFSGPVKVVSQERIEMLDASLGDVSRALSQWGLGVRDLLWKGAAVSAQPDDPSEDVSDRGSS
jgi:hypothetical protein